MAIQLAQSMPFLPVFQNVQFRDTILDRAVACTKHAQAATLPILVSGESGVGKDYIVTQIHARGLRRHRPLVRLGFDTLPARSIAEKLLGATKGGIAPPAFENAHKGTLLLDAVGDLTPELQVLLLRALEYRQTVFRKSGHRITIDVQVIAMTDRTLSDAVCEGSFRRDLYDWLNGAQISLPPLRERPDRRALIRHLLHVEQEALSVKSAKYLSKEVWEIFMTHPWPGNIRELRSLLRSMIAVAPAQIVEVSDLPPAFLAEQNQRASFVDPAYCKQGRATGSIDA